MKCSGLKAPFVLHAVLLLNPMKKSIRRLAVSVGGGLFLASLFIALTACAEASSGVETLHSFTGTSASGDGSTPYSDLLLGSDGSLYGTTLAGGSANYGTVFKLAPGGSLTVLHSFGGTTPKSDGLKPNAGLVVGANGYLYGSTIGGGSADDGTVFEVKPNGSGYNILHSFGTVANDGVDPRADLILGNDGNWYGTTYVGGSAGAGTLYKITSGGSVTVLHSFNGSNNGDGTNPYAGLLQASDGFLYGTTYSGGKANAGTIFKIKPSGSNYSLIHSFGDGTVPADGSYPFGDLIVGLDGNLYGTTLYGGTTKTGSSSPSLGDGTVYKISEGGTVTILHSFGDGSVVNDGEQPYAALVLAQDNSFYGTTFKGGSDDEGTTYKISPSGTLAILYSFDGGSDSSADGAFSLASMIEGSDGTLYGTTPAGGTSNDGTIFSLTLPPASPEKSLLINTAKTPGGSGHTVYGIVNLNGSAPVGGEVVAISSNAPNLVGLPSTITIPAGASTGTFPITTIHVPATINVTISANAGGMTDTAILKVTFQITRMSFSPATVTGGHTSTATVTLSSPASSNQTIMLKSSDESVASVPASFVISQGATQGTFKCFTTKVTASTPVNIEAYANNAGHLTETLTVAAP